MRPFKLIRPQGRPSPVIVSVPHAGLEVPAEVEGELRVDETTLRADADLAVDELYEGVEVLGATLLVANVSRFVVDLNRGGGDVDALSVPEHPAPLADARRGVIWRVATSGRNVLVRPLSMDDLARRLARWHEPYHETLRGLMEETRARHGYAILVDGHSMPATSRDGGGRRHADIVPGCLGGSSCSAALVRTACAHFEGRSYSVAVDDPYRGGFITRTYGRPQKGWHALQLEVSRDLYLDPLTLVPRPRGVARLRTDLGAFIQSVSALRLA